MTHWLVVSPHRDCLWDLIPRLRFDRTIGFVTLENNQAIKLHTVVCLCLVLRPPFAANHLWRFSVGCDCGCVFPVAFPNLATTHAPRCKYQQSPKTIHWRCHGLSCREVFVWDLRKTPPPLHRPPFSRRIALVVGEVLSCGWRPIKISATGLIDVVFHSIKDLHLPMDGSALGRSDR